MAGVTIKIDVVATNADGSERWESHTSYANLDPQQELFVEKHLLNALNGMNAEAGQMVAAKGVGQAKK